MIIPIISTVAERSEAISGITERIDVLAKVAARVIQLTVKTAVYLRQVGMEILGHSPSYKLPVVRLFASSCSALCSPSVSGSICC